MSIADALTILIRDSGMSLRCIAKRSGVDRTLLSLFMRRKSMLSLRNVERVLAALNATCELKRAARG